MGKVAQVNFVDMTKLLFNKIIFYDLFEKLLYHEKTYLTIGLSFVLYMFVIFKN
jgi:hypothetical protein